MFTASQYDTKAGNAGGVEARTDFDFSSRFVSVTIWDAQAMVKLIYPGVLPATLDEIEYDPTSGTMGFPIMIPFQATGFTIRNKTAAVARYEITAYR